RGAGVVASVQRQHVDIYRSLAELEELAASLRLVSAGDGQRKARKPSCQAGSHGDHLAAAAVDTQAKKMLAVPKALYDALHLFARAAAHLRRQLRLNALLEALSQNFRALFEVLLKIAFLSLDLVVGRQKGDQGQNHDQGNDQSKIQAHGSPN